MVCLLAQSRRIATPRVANNSHPQQPKNKVQNRHRLPMQCDPQTEISHSVQITPEEIHG